MENVLLGLILFFSLEREWRFYLLDIVDMVVDALEPGIA